MTKQQKWEIELEKIPTKGYGRDYIHKPQTIVLIKQTLHTQCQEVIRRIEDMQRFTPEIAYVSMKDLLADLREGNV